MNNKVAVITGAGSGIGRALALALQQAGARLALNDINAVTLKETVNLLPTEPSSVLSKVFDVANKKAMYAFAEEVHTHFGQVDIVINNAGVTLESYRLSRLDYEDFEWVMNINFWGMVYGSKAFLPYLAQSSEAALLNVSSIFGIMSAPTQGSYCASKFAIKGFTDSLRMEMYSEAPHITVSSIHPGGVATNIVKNNRFLSDPSEKKKEAYIKTTEAALKLPAEKAAAIILKGIRKKRERIMVGSDAKTYDIMVRLFPQRYTRMVNWIAKKMGLFQD